jgi:hypothetical protein
MAAKQDSRQYRGCRTLDEGRKVKFARRESSTVLMPKFWSFWMLCGAEGSTDTDFSNENRASVHKG